MANNKTYTKVEIEAIKEGLSHYFPYELGEASGPKVVDDNWSDYNKIFKWYGRDDFFTTLSEATGIQKLSFTEIKGASNTLEKMEGAAPKIVEFKGAKEGLASTTPNKEIISEEAIKKNEQKIAETKAATEKSNQDVQNTIKRKQEIQKAKILEEALKNKKVYYKVEKISVSDAQNVEELKRQAEANPHKFIEDATNQFSKNPSLKNLPNIEAQIISKQAAITSYEVLTDNSPLIQSVIISKAVSDPKILNSIPDTKIKSYLKNAADLLTNEKLTQYELGKQLFNFSKLDGHEDVRDINIKFSYLPQPGYKEFDFNDQIVTPHIENLNQENSFLENIKDFGEGEIKSQVLLRAGIQLENYIAKLPANSLLAKTYNSDVVQLGLTSFGIVEAAPWVAVEGSFLGKVVVGSGLGPVAGFIQAKTGINLGVKLAAKEGVKNVAKTGAKAAISKVTTAISTAIPIPGVNWIIGWIGGELLGKIIEKIPWKSIKKWSAPILGSAAMLAALPFIGIVGIQGVLVAGIGTTALSVGLGGGVGGLTLAKVGQGIVTGLKTYAKFIVITIGTPILVGFLVFPLIVALILFIINSGAYVVPPSISLLGSENPYIDIAKTSDPAGPFENSDLPKIITYTITITAKQQALTNVVVKDECTVISEAGSRDCPAPDIVVPGGTISGGSPFVFTYTANFDKSYEDSLVVNTVTVTADTEEGGDPQTATGGLSITIGKPPTDCLKIDGAWPANYRANMESAVGTLASKYSNYLSKVCLSRPEIPLRFSPGGMGGLWGWNAGSYINFFPLGLGKPVDALYILAHELGHSLASGSQTAHIHARYTAYPGIKSEAPYCFYAATASWNEDESLPEAIALTIIEPYCGSVQSRWPRHATFLRTYVFN